MRGSRCLFPFSVCCVCFSSFLSFGLSTAVGQEDTTATRVTLKDDRRDGSALLLASKWSEATNVYGVRYWELQEDVRSTWHADQRFPNELERDRFRIALLHFYFSTMNFSQVGWSAPLVHNAIWEVGKYGAEYQQMVARLPAAERENALDFSHLDLLQIVQGKIPGDPFGNNDQLVLAALRSDPSSIPAAAALMFLLERRTVTNSPASWEDAIEVARSPWCKLALLRCAATNRLIDGDVRNRIIDENLGSVPTAEEKAMLLLQVAKLDAEQKTNARSLSRALNYSQRAYREFPETESAAEARPFAVSLLASTNNAQHALALLRSFQESTPKGAGLDRALFSVSCEYFRVKQLDVSETLLRELLRDYATTPTASRAMLGLADIRAARNDPKGEREWLLQCARFEMTDPTGRSIMDTDNTRSVAIQRLAQGSESKGEWTDALHWWQSWHPTSSCGTCLGQMKGSKQYHICYCLLQLGRTSEAASTCLSAVFGSTWMVDPRLSLLLHDLYRQSKQLGDLINMLDEFEREKLIEFRQQNPKIAPEQILKGLATHSIREAIRIDELIARQDYAQLIQIVHAASGAKIFDEQDRWRDWKARLATDGLCRNDRELEHVRQALMTVEKNTIWLIYALGNSRSPKALEILKDAARVERGSNVDNIAYAISQHGEPGKRVLEDLQNQKGTDMTRAAALRLEQLNNATPTGPRPWPAAKPGSLPKTRR